MGIRQSQPQYDKLHSPDLNIFDPQLVEATSIAQVIAKTNMSHFEVKFAKLDFLKYGPEKKISVQGMYELHVQACNKKQKKLQQASKALNALFALLDQDKDEHVTFEEYMIAMATFVRDVTNLLANENAMVNKQDVLVLQQCCITEQLCSKNDANVINELFGKQNQVTSEQFCSSAKKYTTVLDVFGIGSAFFAPILESITKITDTPNYEMEGTLSKKELTLDGSWKTKQFSLKGGVLAEHKEDVDSSIQATVRLIPVFGARIREMQVPNEPFIFEFKTPELVLFFKANTEAEYKKWMHTIYFYILEEVDNPYNAFAPLRKNVNAIWYINGKPFFERLADALESAKEEIYLTCWFISPEIFLRRNLNNPRIEDRFDYILKKKAEEGVMIYMILWNETKFAQAGLRSGYAAEAFTKMHPNFKIMCHPPSFPFVWAHHQKMLIIDQNIAFHGGLDVCWGRWDDTEHRIADPCHFCLTWPGKDYFNPTIKGTSDVENPHNDHIDRLRYPRMPWHDIHIELDGLAARDVARCFVERWNNNRNDMIRAEMNLANRFAVQKDFPVLTWKTTTPPLTMLNPYNPKLCTSSAPKRKVPKSLYLSDEDVEATLIASPLPKAQEANPFIEEMPMPPPFELDLGDKDTNVHTCTIQNLRSMAPWAGSSGIVETSIYNCWMDILNKAEHYIYIENQYFVSNSAGHGVQNQVAEAIMNRVRWAIKNNKTFRVYIVLPVHPDGRIGESCSVRYIQWWAYQTISRGGTSMIETLQNEFPHLSISDYIAVYAMRTHDFICGRPVTEQIYAHAKVFVVDDKYVIIGSANVNDRSLVGTRDSEFATLVEDTRLVKSMMDGKEYMANRFALTFRLHLFKEFLGLTDEETYKVLDPISNATYKHLMMKTAIRNTNIYQEVFPYAVSSAITSWDKLVDKDQECTIINPKLIKKLDEVKGFLVMWPQNFLIDDSLAPSITDWQSMYTLQTIYQ